MFDKPEPKYVVIRWAFDIGGYYIKSSRLFHDLDDACRYAYLKNGKVFGLSPEYEFSVEAKPISAASALGGEQTND
jgi:hypothetical protein